jgi:hypothetical protein
LRLNWTRKLLELHTVYFVLLLKKQQEQNARCGMRKVIEMTLKSDGEKKTDKK